MSYFPIFKFLNTFHDFYNLRGDIFNSYLSENENFLSVKVVNVWYVKKSEQNQDWLKCFSVSLWLNEEKCFMNKSFKNHIFEIIFVIMRNVWYIFAYVFFIGWIISSLTINCKNNRLRIELEIQTYGNSKSANFQTCLNLKSLCHNNNLVILRSNLKFKENCIWFCDAWSNFILTLTKFLN